MAEYIVLRIGIFFNKLLKSSISFFPKKDNDSQPINVIKNTAIKTYGNVYAIETFKTIGPKIRAAHRFITRAAHTDWRQFADLPGPNITNHCLYTSYGLSSISEIHRWRRNNFLISAESSPSNIHLASFGHAPRIT